MRIIWLGHSGFRIEIAGAVLLVDPWLAGNPMFDPQRRDEAVAGATHLLLSHGHGDHASNALQIAEEGGIPIVCIHELAERWSDLDGIETLGFGKGGTVALGGRACVSQMMRTASGSPTPMRLCGSEPVSSS